MIRKLLLPVAAVVLLGGCMAGGYNYRGGSGDYYYGQPSVDYRYYGSPYGSYYGYPGYYRHRYGYRGYYGYPYYSRHYYYRPRPPVVISPRPGGGDEPNPPAVRPDKDEGAPWRNLDDLRRPDNDRNRPGPSVRRVVPKATPRPSVRRPVRQATPRPAIRRPSAESRMERMERVIKRSRRGKSDQRQPPR